MTEHNQGENPDQNTNKPAMSTSVGRLHCSPLRSG